LSNAATGKNGRVRRLIALLVVVLAAVVAAAALAADTDRVRLLRSLSVEVTTLPEYVTTGFDGDTGGWRGPRCETYGPPALGRALTVTWSVRQLRVGSAARALDGALAFDWPVVERGTVQLRRVTGGREAGTIPAVFVVTDSRAETGHHESAVAFPLARGRFVAARFWSAGNLLPCEVRGVPVNGHHRRIARDATRQLQVDGSLPPARVLARASGRRVVGSVRDAIGQPVFGVAVVLQRRTGRGWRKASSARTRPTGAYALSAPRPGLYRAVATLERISARSAPVRVR
jgi:hypothetical protein